MTLMRLITIKYFNRLTALIIIIEMSTILTSSLGAFDKLFKAHFVFGILYNKMLQNMYTFVQTTVYNIDIGKVLGEPTRGKT